MLNIGTSGYRDGTNRRNAPVMPYCTNHHSRCGTLAILFALLTLLPDVGGFKPQAASAQCIIFGVSA